MTPLRRRMIEDMTLRNLAPQAFHFRTNCQEQAHRSWNSWPRGPVRGIDCFDDCFPGFEIAKLAT